MHGNSVHSHVFGANVTSGVSGQRPGPGMAGPGCRLLGISRNARQLRSQYSCHQSVRKVKAQ